MSTPDRVRDVVEAPLAACGFVVEDVSVTPAGRRRVVRVLVERSLAALAPDDETSAVAPVSLDDVATATRAVSDLLDASGAMGEAHYVLEVSSPGVGRPLRRREQLRRNVGRLVALRTDAEGDPGRPYPARMTGRLTAVGERVRLERPAEGREAAQVWELPLTAVIEGRVQVEFARHDGTGEDS